MQSSGPAGAQAIAEWLVGVPFRPATIAALWWLVGLVVLRMTGRGGPFSGPPRCYPCSWHSLQ